MGENVKEKGKKRDRKGKEKGKKRVKLMQNRRKFRHKRGVEYHFRKEGGGPKYKPLIILHG